MADQGSEPRGQRTSSERFAAAAGVPAFDLAAALEDLDQATRNFAERLGSMRDADREAAAPGPAAAPSTDREVPPAASATPGDAARSAFEARMRDAEREAGAYLEHAKRRADSLVNAMVGAVEREAAEMRREAEAGIRARWQATEVEAARHVEEARRVADRMVAERQRGIAALSDGIAARAQALTIGMDDAERIRTQFDAFVRALSHAAGRIASAPELASPPPREDGGERDRTRPIAA